MGIKERKKSPVVELANSQPGSRHLVRRAADAREDKVLFDAAAGEGHAVIRSSGASASASDGIEREVVMSATSYPGQEWNPFGAGAWDGVYE